MGYLKDFTVNIVSASTAVAQKGFGTILIASTEVTNAYTSYASIADVESDYVNTTDTYAIASKLFGQGVAEIAIVGELDATDSELVTLLNSVANEAFFGVVSNENADAYITAISNWIDTQERVYAVTTQSKVLTGTSDQTMAAYHPDEYGIEACLAYLLVREIGSTDLDGKLVSGITSSLVTKTEYDVLKANNVNVFLEKYGNIVVDGGNMIGGEAIDVILGKFWIKARMEEDLALLKLNTPKIPYTNAGVSLLIDVATTRLKLAANQGIIALDDAGNPQFTVTYLPVEDVPDADKAARKYDYVKWEAVLAGSIREGTVSGVLTL